MHSRRGIRRCASNRIQLQWAASKCRNGVSAASWSATGGTIVTGGKAIMEETGIELEGIGLESSGRAKRVAEPDPAANSAAKADAAL
jgi:hypothetical protein